MIAVITGDIVNSSKGNPQDWLPGLKSALATYGSEPEKWEVYRGDSFQITLPAKKALEAAYYIKASIKQLVEYDVRMGVGIGSQDFKSSRVSESNGSAFVRSGGAFDKLGRDLLSVVTGKEELDEALEVMIRLASLTMNDWTSKSAEVIRLKLENPNWNQLELARRLEKSQSSVSESFSRAGFDELMRLNEYFKKSISTL